MFFFLLATNCPDDWSRASCIILLGPSNLTIDVVFLPSAAAFIVKYALRLMIFLIISNDSKYSKINYKNSAYL